MASIPLDHVLLLAAVLFALGLIGVLVRRNLIFMLMTVPHKLPEQFDGTYLLAIQLPDHFRTPMLGKEIEFLANVYFLGCHI